MAKLRLLLSLTVLLSHSPRANAQSLPACSSAEVTYSSAPNDIEKNIQVSQVDVPLPTSKAKRVGSMRNTRWFVEVDPDYMANGPWTTTLYFGRAGSNRVVLQASFKDHGNTFSAYWLNEKLVFIQVWWGRIASSDLILDVTNGRLVYNQLADYGQTVEPCN